MSLIALAPVAVFGGGLYLLYKDAPPIAKQDTSTYLSKRNAWTTQKIGDPTNMNETQSKFLGYSTEPSSGIPCRVWQNPAGQLFRTYDVGQEETTRYKAYKDYE